MRTVIIPVLALAGLVSAGNLARDVTYTVTDTYESCWGDGVTSTVAGPGTTTTITDAATLTYTVTEYTYPPGFPSTTTQKKARRTDDLEARVPSPTPAAVAEPAAAMITPFERIIGAELDARDPGPRTREQTTEVHVGTCLTTVHATITLTTPDPRVTGTQHKSKWTEWVTTTYTLCVPGHLCGPYV